MQNKIAIIPTPMLIFPVSWDTMLTMVVPTNDAPFPHISMRPKYSPELELCLQKDCKNSDSQISKDTHGDQLLCSDPV